MGEKKMLDLNNLNHQLVVAALDGMVENDGLTPHAAFDVLGDIKRNNWHSLVEIKREVQSG
ncbi:hypothetical protein [Paenibacillus periandrae]|uniref:hypothetical protein n=1 Tax=Paenibacillus periandrae TaxID=1761741 RepID=UPI001F0995DC|nr:hypothetical protein [Paenibacillus periandrae]